MRRIEVAIIVLSILYMTVNAILLLVGEKRPDVYVVVYVLLYLAAYSFDPSLHNNKGLKRINPLLAGLAIALTAYRLYLVLMGAL